MEREKNKKSNFKNQKSIFMKNQIKIQKSESKKSDSKNEKIDSANLQIIGSEMIKGNLYNHNILKGLGKKDMKSCRRYLRDSIDRYIKSILGKDRKEEERSESLKSFIAFYKKYWKIQDFKFENFSNQKDPDFKKDIESIFALCKEGLEKSNKKG